MNTLAGLFVLNIPYSLYSVFTGGLLKSRMKNVKPITIYPTNNERLLSFIFASVIYPVLVVACSGCIVHMDMNNELSVAWLGELFPNLDQTQTS